MSHGRGIVRGGALALAGIWIWLRRARSWKHLHPDLRSPVWRFRWPSTTPLVVKAMRVLIARIPEPESGEGVEVEARHVPGPAGAPDVLVYVYRPAAGQRPAAAVLYLHGGGFMIGSARAAHPVCAGLARDLGVVVVNVEYRLAPGTPFPGALEDCYAALRWMAQRATTLGIDPGRIAVMGESAGGCLAAALAQLAHDRGEVELAFQVLVYPMLDDRTVLRRDHDRRGEFLWTPGSNRLAWTSYLGREPLRDRAPAYAAPARREDLAGLPPAWIGAGTLDLLYPEAAAYARRLAEAGVPCEFDEVTGAFHGFDVLHPAAPLSVAFTTRRLHALRRGLRLSDPLSAGS